MTLFPLADFEESKWLVDVLLTLLGRANTALDWWFYDVDNFVAAMRALGEQISEEDGAKRRNEPRLPTLAEFQEINLSAQFDPEGTILVLNLSEAPYIFKYRDVRDFLQKGLVSERRLETITVTGVGSSALGSAAFAWNVAIGIGAPVAAIVPGFGVADAVSQALGGWFGFEFHDFLRSVTQEFLAKYAASIATLGHGLTLTTPGVRLGPNNSAPVFRYGSPSADILHDILKESRQIRRVVGHSKGALCIANAVNSLDAERADGLEIVTLGCPVDQNQLQATYRQYLGWFDLVGMTNAWGHLPNRWLWATHTTNRTLPLGIPVTELCADELSASRPRRSMRRLKLV
jgi:hypothetical protein